MPVRSVRTTSIFPKPCSRALAIASLIDFTVRCRDRSDGARKMAMSSRDCMAIV
jgi:hypothetical protein